MWNKRTNKSPGFILGFVSALAIALILGLTWFMMNTSNSRKPGLEASLSGRADMLQAVFAQQEVNLTLQKTYVCGTEAEEKVTKMVPSLDQIYLDYQDWELVSQQDNHFVFKKWVHDLAPICREKGYFGLTEDGILTLFEGPPTEERVIQTFFHIDTNKLESTLPQNDLALLKKGIRIHDLAEYNSILSTYGEYADGVIHTQETEEQKGKQLVE